MNPTKKDSHSNLIEKKEVSSNSTSQHKHNKHQKKNKESQLTHKQIRNESNKENNGFEINSKKILQNPMKENGFVCFKNKELEIDEDLSKDGYSSEEEIKFNEIDERQFGMFERDFDFEDFEFLDL